MKAYDIKELLVLLKNNGLELGEEAAKIFVKQLIVWLQQSAALSENKFDDIAALGLPELEKLALALADKINPEDNV